MAFNCRESNSGLAWGMDRGEGAGDFLRRAVGVVGIARWGATLFRPRCRNGRVRHPRERGC